MFEIRKGIGLRDYLDSRKEFHNKKTLRPLRLCDPPRCQFLCGPARQLRQKGQLQEAADLLQVLIDVAEETARRSRSDVPFWYYEELARTWRTQKDARREKKALERFLGQTTGSHPKVEKRFKQRIEQL